MANKLGTETGSVINYLLSGTAGGPAPLVGMGATLLHWTDRTAATITWVSPSGKTLRVREDRAIRTDTHGLSESQTYRYEPEPRNPELTYRLTARGWRRNGANLRVGERSAYRDPSF